MRLKKYLINEAGMITGGWPERGGLCDGLDDAGDTIGGPKYEKVTVKTPGGEYRMSVVVPDWTWDEYEYMKGLEDKKNYHSSLDKDTKYLIKYFGDRVWRHMKKGDVDTVRPKQEDIPEESAPEYVKKVLRFTATRESQSVNISKTLTKIDTIIGRFETATGEEPKGERTKILKRDEPKKVKAEIK